MSYYCKNCDKWWSYPIKRCIFCNNEIQEVIETKYKVIGFTQVYVPSFQNEKVPYYNYLIKDKNGNKKIIKSFNYYQIGNILDLTKDKTKKEQYSCGVIGTGQMGLGIAEFMLRNGHKTIIKTRKNEKKIISQIYNNLSKDNKKEQVEGYMDNLNVVTKFYELKKCDIVVEAIPENIDLKKDVFRKLSKICDPNTIFATNTSSISIDELAKSIDRPDKFVGMHFFNPVSKMDLIEVVTGNETSEYTKEWVVQFSEELKKIPVVVKNSPGFIVNRLLLPQINEAVHLLENKIAKKEYIDKAMKLGLNHPMGPFQLADFIGIDVCVSILETIYNDLEDEKFKPAATLINMVKKDKLGIKSGEGFYKYN